MAGTVNAAGVSWLKWLAFFIAASFINTCACAATEDYQPVFADKPAQSISKEYVFAVYPLHNPERLYAAYGPLIEYLSKHVPGARFRLEASRSYDDFDRKIAEQSAHFLLCNPRQIAIALKHRYKVFAKLGDDAEHYGIILLRVDSPIQSLNDLKGKKISYPAANAWAATLMTQFYLHSQGIDVNHDIENMYVGSQESSILSVYNRTSDAGTTWPLVWRKFKELHPEIARELVVKWRTELHPNNGVAARIDVPPEIVARVKQALLRLHVEGEGRDILNAIPVSTFEPANKETYGFVQHFLRRFSAEIRPVAE